jgi:hypothetical protein
VSIRALLPSIESLTAAACVLLACLSAGPEPKKLADTYVEAVKDVNDAHAKKPVAGDEAALSKKFPAAAAQALDSLLAIKGDEVAAALARCGEAALDLDRMGDFDKVRARLKQIAPESAAALGIAISKPRYLMRGLDGVEEEGLAAVATTFDAILAAYDDVFGFAEWSKIPGKKLRVRVHLVEAITRPPHFAPQFPWHSEIDFPVVDAKGFTSPTPQGKFMLYGLCHELGHVIAMWGDTKNEEDKHQWAHYTGLAIVEHMSKKADPKLMRDLRDVKWRSLEIDRQKLVEAKAQPGRDGDDAVLALFIAIHDLVGTRAVGEAINALDAEDKRLRVNHVRYYGLDAFAKALLATDAGKKKAKELKALFD